MATNTADVEVGEKSPLISHGRDKQPLEEISGTTKTEKAVAGFSLVSFVSSFAGMLMERNLIVYISGIIGIIVSPYAAIQQHKITHVEALAETNERVQQEVKHLEAENEKLRAQIADLGNSVESLQLQKEKLDTINSVQGASLGELEKQLTESKKILGKMKQNLEGELLNNIIDVAIRADVDGDGQMTDDEINRAIQEMSGISGVEVDVDGIRSMIIKDGRSIDAIMDLIRNLLRDDTPPEETLFKYVRKK